MPVGNPLTRTVGLRVGPIILETLVKHYFERIKKDAQEKAKGGMVQLRQDELLYDEAFTIVKAFLEVASYHTVEEVQAFGNTRTPSPPWVKVVRLLVPMSCCDEAATYLVKALGGEDMARRVVGGIKWWQVRGINGVDAQWITAKKDYQEAKRRHKLYQKAKRDPSEGETNTSPSNNVEEGSYDQDMDEMRCILYSHGGGYYFGSVDQERYSIQRYARKINGRVFAINYRLAPQYPFPCAIQDLLAAYLYLIRPPPEAKHRPVKPAHIIVAGDSAGGGLTLALLQVLRDSGLPLPAGGVLVSPWCDMTHSFPSIHTNTATDVIPPYGLSLQKPSTLWPPPPDELTNVVQSRLRSRVRQALRMDERTPVPSQPHVPTNVTASHGHMPVDVGNTTPLPLPNPMEEAYDQTISIPCSHGDQDIIVKEQLQLYTVNNLLGHPLVSPALSYLGGLPPLFIIASDKEVLRDEIIYAAHKAAYPERFPVKDQARALYPVLNGIESRYEATPVHLQVYDDTAHVLPVLFSFTTPAKYCFRAIASFCKRVTGMQLTTPYSPPIDSFPESRSGSFSPPSSPPQESQSQFQKNGSLSPESPSSPWMSFSTGQRASDLKRSFSENVRQMSFLTVRQKRSKSVPRLRDQVAEALTRQEDVPPLPDPPRSAGMSPGSSLSSDVDGPQYSRMASSSPTPMLEVEKFAGDPIVYLESDFPSNESRMIRERVSTQGVIRPLESESELDALRVAPELVGVLSELTLNRYTDGRAKFDKKFSSTVKAINKHRHKHLERAKKDTIRNMSALQNNIEKEEQLKEHQQVANKDQSNFGIKEGLLASSGWSWAWALDQNEKPPPSSIVSRRDTEEAIRLARVADQAVVQDHGSVLSGNNLWSVVVGFLTVKGKDDPVGAEDESGEAQDELERDVPVRKKSLFSKHRFASRDKPAPPAAHDE